MEEKKLTDEEIVKALYICTTADDDMDCIDDYPMYEEDYCTTKLLKMAFDLIRRLRKADTKQKAEIERLEKDVHDMSWIIKMHKYCVGADHCQNSSMKEFKLQKQVDELKLKEGSFKVGTSVVATTKENDLIGYYGTIVKVQPGEVLVEFHMVNGVKGFRAWLKSSEFEEVD